MNKGKYNKLTRRIVIVKRLGFLLKKLNIVSVLPDEKLINIYITEPKYFGIDAIRRFIEDNFN